MKLSSSRARIAFWLATRNEIPERYSLSDDPQNFPDFTYLKIVAPEPISPYEFVVKEVISKNGLEGVIFKSGMQSFLPACISLANDERYNFQIIRIYRNLEIEYKTIGGYIFGELFARHRYEYLRYKFGQDKFNKRLKIRRDRCDLLRFILDRQIQSARGKDYVFSRATGFQSFNLFSEIYTDKVWGHPDHSILMEEFELLLQSLVASGDLSYQNHEYQLEPMAIVNLSQASEKDRRHNDTLSLNRILIFLTAILAISALLDLFIS